MLMSMKAKVAAARAICYVTTACMDIAQRSQDAAERSEAEARAALLTPVAKAFSTDIGVETASEGIQVHGGMGYVEETGAAQIFRDARIAPIYEGTNGIQAVDLVSRKIGMNNGATLRGFISRFKETVRQVKTANEPVFGQMGERLELSVAALEEAGEWLLKTLPENRNAALAGATPFTRLFGLASGGVFLADGALAASRGANGSGANGQAHIIEARHFAENLAGETENLKHAVIAGHETIAGADAVFGG
jgi:hypothetical protein